MDKRPPDTLEAVGGGCDAQVVADLARQAQEVFYDDAVPFVNLAPGQKIESVERFCLTPARVRGVTTVDDLDSFIRYAESHSDDIKGEIYFRCSETSASFACVFNPDGWRDYRAAYTPAPSVEWKRWTGMNGQRKPQADFAAFIEDNAPDIVMPNSADMVEISRSLEAKKAVNFASSIRLDNGQQELRYEEQIDGSAAKGLLRIPELFAVGIPVFVGGDRYRVEARLRYRIDNGKLAMWYDLVRPHLVIADAVQQMVDAIREKVKLPIYRGELGNVPA